MHPIGFSFFLSRFFPSFIVRLSVCLSILIERFSHRIVLQWNNKTRQTNFLTFSESFHLKWIISVIEHEMFMCFASRFIISLMIIILNSNRENRKDRSTRRRRRRKRSAHAYSINHKFAVFSLCACTISMPIEFSHLVIRPSLQATIVDQLSDIQRLKDRKGKEGKGREGNSKDESDQIHWKIMHGMKFR